MLDTDYQVETPEAIDLTAQLAGPVPRILAFLIDFLIRAVLIVCIFVVLGLAGLAGIGVFLLIFFVLDWFYPVLFEVLRSGQTPGKKYLGIAVVNDDLTPVTWSTSMIRNLLRAADFLPASYLLGLIAMCSTRHFQRLGDLAAGSIVIHKHDNKHRSDDLPKVPANAPSLPLSLEDQVAITGFSQRHTQLSQSRKQELANILSNITQAEGDEAVKKLQGMGNWLLGDRE
ncbi:MAG: RDD family protein [Cellvibrionaceae bacterium]|nr:RDD family protein [Cellvibrionaceae bacterium]